MPPMLGATGIGVSNLDRSIEFYTKVLDIGLTTTQFFDVETYKEAVLAFPRGKHSTGSPILLMQYKSEAPPRNQQGKLVFYVDDPKVVMEKCRQHGSEVYKEIGSGEGWVKAIGMVRDPDGFLLEFMPISLLRASASMGEKPKI